ncbi:MAG: 1-acyl-sn-glycerol-3-phosphate acyltransferase [Acetobacteraceae bacterium]|nr:1-acyl-sn-glycerol-3-phosphate acyltransferase [Acetobacteraceae bacterium]
MRFFRSAFFNLFFFASTALLALYGIAAILLAPRLVLRLPLQWARLELAALRTLCGIRFTVLGKENLPGGPALIASQHQSTFDTIVWFLVVPHCSYVLKRELTQTPLFGMLLRPAGMIVIDRKAGARAIRGLVRDVSAAMRAGRRVVIFPEGTRAEPDRPHPIQPGIAALASVLDFPILPVTTDSGRFWGRRAFHKRPGEIRIAIHPPLPSGLSRKAVLAHLDALYRAGSSVDNSVGGPPSRLQAESSRKREDVDFP